MTKNLRVKPSAWDGPGGRGEPLPNEEVESHDEMNPPSYWEGESGMSGPFQRESPPLAAPPWVEEIKQLKERVAQLEEAMKGVKEFQDYVKYNWPRGEIR